MTSQGAAILNGPLDSLPSTVFLATESKMIHVFFYKLLSIQVAKSTEFRIFDDMGIKMMEFHAVNIVDFWQLFYTCLQNAEVRLIFSCIEIPVHS